MQKIRECFTIPRHYPQNIDLSEPKRKDPPSEPFQGFNEMSMIVHKHLVIKLLKCSHYLWVKKQTNKKTPNEGD